jgi:hypothetical protein
MVSDQNKSCMVWRFHGGDYEECSLLGYKTQVRISQETYISATEPSGLTLCKTWDFNSGECEECSQKGKNPVRTAKETHCLRWKDQPMNAM